MFDRGAHQLMIGRMKFHQINAMAVPVMADEYRFVLIGEEPGCHQRSAGQRTVGIDPRLGPTGAKAARQNSAANYPDIYLALS